MTKYDNMLYVSVFDGICDGGISNEEIVRSEMDGAWRIHSRAWIFGRVLVSNIVVRHDRSSWGVENCSGAHSEGN